MSTRCQVVIVGGGPVGVALAVELAQRKISCVVVERHHEVGRIPKGQNLTQRTLEHFYFWHCVDELRARRLLEPTHPIGGVTAYGSLSGEYWYAPAGLEVMAPYFYERQERLPQYLTEEVLRERMAELDHVTARFGWTAKAIEQGGSGVRVTISSEDWPYEDDVVEGDFVVGCDGARSLVREQCGIEREGPNFDQKMVLAVMRSTELNELLKRFPERTTYRVLTPELGGIWQFFGRVDSGETWFFHAPVDRDMELGDTETLNELVRRAAGRPVACTFDYVGFWELRVEVATTYRHGRAFIAGDAAHTHPPYGGYGLNTGLEDVTNLGWKLAAVLDGWGGPLLLDSYTAERQPVFKQTGERVIAGGIERDREFMERYSPTRDEAEFASEWSKRTGGDVAGPRYEPNYAGSPVVFGPPGASVGVDGAYSFEARAGHHLTPAQLSSGTDIYERLGSGFTLIALDSPDASAAFVAAAERLGVPLEVVEDRVGGAREAWERRLILVRPDQFVAWAGDEVPGDPDEVIRRAIGH